jgi:hypothetical protein
VSNRDKLETLGRALYGTTWQNKTISDLDVNARTFERWLAGSTEIPDGVIADLVEIASKRRAVLDEAIRSAKVEKQSQVVVK